MQYLGSIPEERIQQLTNQLMSDPRLCKVESRKILSHIQKDAYPFETARLLYIQAVGDYYQAQTHEAIQALNRALELLAGLETRNGEVLHWTLRAKTALALCYLADCDFARAIYLLLEVKDRSQQENDSYSYAYSLTYLGGAYGAIGRHDQALEYLQAAEQAPEAEQHGHLKGITYLYLGNAFSRMQDYDNALAYLHQSLEAFENHSLADTPEVLITMGEIFLNRQDYLRADQFISFALDQAREKGTPAAEIHALALKAEVSKAKGIEPQAIEELKKAMELSESHRLDQQTLETARRLHELYLEAGDYIGACQYSKRAMELNQTIVHENTLSDIKVMELSNELKKAKHDRTFLKKRISRLQLSNDQIRSIGKLSEEVNSLMDLDLVIDTVYTKLHQIFPIDSFGVLLYEKEKEELAFRYQIVSQRYVQHTKNISLNNRSSIEACCARTRKPILISDIETEGQYYRGGPVSDAQNQFRSWMLIPLEARGELLGVLSLQAEREEAYLAQDLDIIRMLANQLAIATANFRTLENLQEANDALNNDKQQLYLMNRELQDAKTRIEQLAIYDDLTGLPNRHLLYERAVPMLHLAKRNRTPFAVCFIDIDNFKQINDSLGHWAGDEALRIIGRRILRSLRKSDLVARLGGDEFVAVFNDLKRKESISVILDKLIKEISSPLEIGRQQFLVSASIGVSFYPEHASEFTDLLHLADQAQYAAKHQGKNGYLIYDQLERSKDSNSQDLGGIS